MASTTGQMSVVGGKFVLDHTLTQQTGTVIDFNTTDQFIDKEIRLQLAARPATAALTLTGNTTQSPTWGTATSGYYYPTNNISADLNVSTSGWVETSGYSESDSIGIGKVSQSIMQQGTTTIASGSTIVPTDSNQTITITEGYNAARTLVVGAADSGAAGEITSGSATIDSLSYAYDSSTSKFNVTGSADVSAPTINTPGYISSTKGTKNTNTNGATVLTTVDQIRITATLSGTTTALKPTLSKQTIEISNVTDAASGASTSTAPTSGVYVAVRSNANTGSITTSPSVGRAGYGTTSNYTSFASGGSAATVGAAQSDIYYIPITTTTPTVSGRTVSYTDGWVSAGSTSVALGTVKSGNVSTLTYGTPTYDSTNDNFTVAVTGTVPAPTVSTAGYVSSSEGTKQTGAVDATQTLNKIEVGASYTGTLKVTPAISRTAKPNGDTWIDAASGAVTTTKPTTGAYVRVDAAAKSNNVNITGTVTAAGYGTTSNYDTAAATVLSVGSNAATATYVPIKVGRVTGDMILVSANDSYVDYNSADDNFDIAFTQEGNPPHVAEEGYISNDIGTKTAGSAVIDITLQKIGIQANLSGTGTKKPSIAKHSNSNVASSAATTTKPSSGYYVAVNSAANTGTVQATASVSSAGYGTTIAGEYTTTPSSSLTVGASASDVTYIPITEATFANSAISGTTYTDISSTAPVLISGDYLYINPGYVPASKISLAKLVPDAEGANAPANYILSGYTAFDNNGALITGTMATYAGAYTITTT